MAGKPESRAAAPSGGPRQTRLKLMAGARRPCRRVKAFDSTRGYPGEGPQPTRRPSRAQQQGGAPSSSAAHGAQGMSRATQRRREQAATARRRSTRGSSSGEAATAA
eukprot:5378125-Pleurochrysis_carterae.AAC.1